MGKEGRIKGSGGAATCPDARISISYKYVDGHRTLDLDTYILYFITTINNTFNSLASQLYLEKFGVGVVEWRVAAMLALEPRIPAARICEIVAIDKAAASRALNKLEQLGHVEFEANERDPRRRIWWLNERGYALHDAIIDIAFRRERRLIEGVDPHDLEATLRVLRIMSDNVRTLGEIGSDD